MTNLDNKIKIIIAGDLCPNEEYEEIFIGGMVSQVIDVDFLNSLNPDIFIANLESPLIEKSTPIIKIGPVLGVNIKAINGIRQLGINAVSIANNHILDHGEDGLSTTIKILEKNGIKYVGAGMDGISIGKILKYRIRGIDINIIAMAEKEFSISKTGLPGANCFDILDLIDELKHIQDAYNILIFHTGQEKYELINCDKKRLCRFLANQGIDLIVCQHSHYISGYEKYNGASIYYGQGNFIFGMKDDWRGLWNEGYILEVNLNNSGH